MEDYRSQFKRDHYHTSLISSTPSFALASSHFFAILFCYLIGYFGLNVLFVAPIAILLWSHWKECYDVFVWTTQLHTEYLMMKKNAQKNGESVEWINHAVKKWWTCCDGAITNFVKDWVEPIVEKFKFQYLVESIRILTFNTGIYRIKFTNLRLLQAVKKPKSSDDDISVFIPIKLETMNAAPIAMAAQGRCTLAFEVDAELDVPNAEFKMKSRLGGVHQHLLLNIESFYIKGRVFCVFNADKKAPFPHFTTGDICFRPTPQINVNCRLLKNKLEVSNTPVLKQMMEKYIEMGFERLLVYPGKQRVDFTPTPLPGPEWEEMRSNGVSKGVLTVTIQNVNTENDSIKKIVSSKYYFKLKLGSQKCFRRFSSPEWSSTFSFLVYDPLTEKLMIKVKTRRRLLHDNVVDTQHIPLSSLGIGQDSEEQPANTKVRMSVGDKHLLFSLCYTPLPQFSLLHVPSVLDHEYNISGAGVLYIHVHAARNLIGHSSRAGYEPYCVVRHGKRTIFKTHSLSGSSDPIWEKGTEILVPSCRGMELIFDVIHDGHTLGSHDLIGTAQLRLDTGQSQLIQHRLKLYNPLRKPLHLSHGSSLYISAIFRNVESVNWTRDSLQEAFMSRTQRESEASCLDNTTKFLNPLDQSFIATTAGLNSELSSSDEDNFMSVNDVRDSVLSGPEDSLLIARR